MYYPGDGDGVTAHAVCADHICSVIVMVNEATDNITFFALNVPFYRASREDPVHKLASHRTDSNQLNLRPHHHHHRHCQHQHPPCGPCVAHCPVS